MTELKNDRSYIKTLLKIAIPMMVQNGISNFVNLLDNLKAILRPHPPRGPWIG